MNWNDFETYVEIYPPEEFNFNECLVFLSRSSLELLHQIKDGSVYKLIKVNKIFILLKVGYNNRSIIVEFPISTPSEESRKQAAEYIWEWLDLGQDLAGFYEMAAKDRILSKISNKYYGLRIIGIPDLFESLIWAVIGQQINLTFAYKLKKRFVERFGESLTFNGDTFWIFPSFEKIASIDVEDLKKLQFTGRKAEYIIGIAKAMKNRDLSKETLLNQDYHQVKRRLTEFRGVGAWTADYVMMKCLNYNTSFPIGDAGLHNALKSLLGFKRKPAIEEIKEFAENWDGWQAYATFYLWRSLYE
ncbi:DNA-3-methyladenine glycosylase [Paenibacillus sp. BSR1-1]|uniref:DNA-3-methyladenine glycosylase 2 n=1 Tax=Paenibacillus sp. BSR1-1 TaxID=3020845 RepID=UPI0025B1E373|nr:DNA-3-methyladenine glycosylase [Paenibacillus sp. BSR1-1]MDN3017215.1 DNA-3-methyladenine glycosylase [Paenibacillus sp. BSR1-1]